MEKSIEKSRKELIDELIKILDLHKNKEGFIKYTMLYKLLVGFRDRKDIEPAEEDKDNWWVNGEEWK